MTKAPTLSKVIFDQGGAIWFGGLARLDLIQGPSVGAIIFMSNEVTIVRNTIQKANINYIKGFGSELFPTYGESPEQTVFIKHRVILPLEFKHRINQHELAVHGLGSVVFKQLENTNLEQKTAVLDLYLPENVGFSIRPSLIGPQEAQEAKSVVRKARRGNQSVIN